MDRSGQSSLGTASLILSLIGAVLLFVWVFSSDNPGVSEMVIGALVLAQVFISLLGTGLGIPPLFSTSKKRGFAITGVVVGVASLVLSASLYAIGIYLINTGAAT